MESQLLEFELRVKELTEAVKTLTQQVNDGICFIIAKEREASEYKESMYQKQQYLNRLMEIRNQE